MDHGARKRVAEWRTGRKIWPNSVFQILRQEQRQGCPGDWRTSDGQTIEVSQITEEVIEGTMGVRGRSRYCPCR